MDGYEYLRLGKSLKAKYISDLKNLMNEFIYSNISFKVGDTVEVKNITFPGKYIVDEIYMNFDDDFDSVVSPSCYLHAINVTGRRINERNVPNQIGGGFRATDVVKVIK